MYFNYFVNSKRNNAKNLKCSLYTNNTLVQTREYIFRKGMKFIIKIEKKF